MSPAATTPPKKWEFWIDRGGTFTDVVARRPDGSTVTHKLLSENLDHYDDAAVEAIRLLMDVAPGGTLPVDEIEAVKMGTTVATNALLERTGEPTVLFTTKGFAEALRIGYQARPDLFALDIVLPDMLYTEVVEVDERVSAHGDTLVAPDLAAVERDLRRVKADGFDSVAISFVHGYRHTKHEEQVARLARDVGFAQVSVGHEVSPLMKLVARGDTTVVDAYLSPVLRRYVDSVDASLGGEGEGPRLQFMQSHGGLSEAREFQGKDSLLSGPAGGVVGMVRTASEAGFDQLIGFDMGGTSTDVSHYAGELERTYETEVAGVRVRAPMMHIHTVAAGGGSILHFDGSRMRVGPDSAGADPGPRCYGNSGPLAITDCNVLLGKLRPDYFPHLFGPDGSAPLSTTEVVEAFRQLADEINHATGGQQRPEDVAEGFLRIATDNMANAIKKISVQRGYDVSTYTLVCFGGAGGQHACMVADRLGVERIHIHPFAGVLSAVGIGLADARKVSEQTVEAPFGPDAFAPLEEQWRALEAQARADLVGPDRRGDDNLRARLEVSRRASLRAGGSDTSFFVEAASEDDARAQFDELHHARFGFVATGDLTIEAIQVEVVEPADTTDALRAAPAGEVLLGTHDVWLDGAHRPVPFLRRSALQANEPVDGPTVLVEDTGTTVVEPGWQAVATGNGDLILERVAARPDAVGVGTEVDPVQLEIFNNLFMNVAEQMGVVLEMTAASVNIKERLDFSCAIFDPHGELVANAPHMPVHLGSMSESIKSIIAANPEMERGQVFVMNAPYQGGTHLPDITVIKPVFTDGPSGGSLPIFYVASRGHHADIGGTVPGSMPCDSTSVEEEGVLLENVVLVQGGHFQDERIRDLLTGGDHPARNPDQNVADLKAQVAACEKGAAELGRVIGHYGLDVVHAYMQHVKDNAEESVRRVIDALSDSSFVSEADDGSRIAVTITVDEGERSAVIDFTGTSPIHPGNFNAPSAIAHAAVLYVFRCMVSDTIPLNAGCMKPLRLVLPPDSMVNPSYPAAVIAGNVETSQAIVDTLLGALGVAAGSQGTMNNVIWGNATHQYYETVAGGAGATPNADGCSAVHTHMTNSRLTDPEVLEWRFPVLLESFEIRHGSGGRGAHRGGDGTVRRVRFGEAMELNVISSHRRTVPYGVDGGEPGAAGINRVLRADGSVVEMAGSDHAMVGPGDVFEILTPGGGGFGPPPAD